MSILDRPILDAICEAIPKDQSAFDSALSALRAANDGILDETVPGVVQVVIEAELIWEDGIERGAKCIVELLLQCGINKTNVIQQKRIAMYGAIPNFPDPTTPVISNESAAMIQTLCMQIAFYKLIDIIRKADITLYAKRACKTDMSCILSFSWDGIYNWRI